MFARRVHDWLFPLDRLKRTEWAGLWQQQDRATVVKYTRRCLIAAAILLTGHLVVIDRLLLHLEPAYLWAIYRIGLASLALLGVGITHTRRFAESNHHRWVLALYGFAIGYGQAHSMTWWSGVPYYFAVIIPCVAVWALRITPLFTGLYLLVAYALQIPAYIAAPQVNGVTVGSAAGVAVVILMMLRSSIGDEVRAFISRENARSAKEKLIALQQEQMKQLQTYLPHEIFRRIEERMTTRSMTIQEAEQEVLRPEYKLVACLHSDIRSYTQQSKDPRYVLRSAMPSIRRGTEIIEEHRGIPRLHGDLIFAYFDDESAETTLCSALHAAMALVVENIRFNETLPVEERIRRRVLVSFGRATVGNIGGENSAREITALGPPANILSRIDELTKNPRLAALLRPDMIVLDRSAAELTALMGPGLAIEEVNLTQLGVSIRDFPSETAIFLMTVPVTEISVDTASELQPSPHANVLH